MMQRQGVCSGGSELRVIPPLREAHPCPLPASRFRRAGVWPGGKFSLSTDVGTMSLKLAKETRLLRAGRGPGTGGTRHAPYTV